MDAVLTQSDAFESFLGSFKSTPVSTLASAIDGMNIDEDDFSDDYDFMDDEEEETANARRQARKQANQPSLKYVELLQKIADRVEDEITIDLDDVVKVGFRSQEYGTALMDQSTTEHWKTTARQCIWLIPSKQMRSTI